MGYVLLGACLGILPSLLMFYLVIHQQRQFQNEKNQWDLKEERLLNRAMTKEWESYTQLSHALMNQALPSTSEPYQGMNDEEELRRFGQQPVGEVLVDYSDDLRELGLT